MPPPEAGRPIDASLLRAVTEGAFGGGDSASLNLETRLRGLRGGNSPAQTSTGPCAGATIRRCCGCSTAFRDLSELLSRASEMRTRQKPFQAQTSQQNVRRNGKRIVTTV